jgi:hypothetical protein
MREGLFDYSHHLIISATRALQIGQLSEILLLLIRHRPFIAIQILSILIRNAPRAVARRFGLLRVERPLSASELRFIDWDVAQYRA